MDERWEIGSSSEWAYWALGITQAQSVSNSLVSRAQWSEWYHDDDQWSVMGVSWPQFMTPHPAGASEGGKWMVGGQMESCVQCVYRVYRVFTSPDMVHGRVSGLFTHGANLTSPAMSGDSVSSADTRCLQWSLVSTSADSAACSAESPAVLGAVKDSVYLLCDSRYWGLQRECEQAILSNSMVLVLLNGVYFGLQTTKEWLKRVSDTFVKIIDVVLLLKNDFGLELALMVIKFGCSWTLILFS